MRFRQRFSPFPTLCGLILLLSALLPLPQNGAILGLPSLCPFHNLTGLPCPGCGLTRAFVCCAHGQITAAFIWHPLGPILFALALFLVGNDLAKRKAPQVSRRLWLIGILAFGAIWVLRLGGIFALPIA